MSQDRERLHTAVLVAPSKERRKLRKQRRRAEARLHEGAAGVEVLADEHPIGTEAAFGDERVRPRQGRGGVLVTREPEPSRRPELRRPRLTCLGQVDRGFRSQPADDLA